MKMHTRRNMTIVIAAASAMILSVCGLQSISASDDASSRIDRARSDKESIVLSISKVVRAGLNKEDFVYQACQSWTLSKRQVRAFFLAATSISTEDRHSAYGSMPCAYEGTLQSGEFVYEYSINAGLHGYLRELNGSDREFYFGCKVRCTKLTPFADLYEEDE